MEVSGTDAHANFPELHVKSTTVQTLGELRMLGTANRWAGLFRAGLPLAARGESDTG